MGNPIIQLDPRPRKYKSPTYNRAIRTVDACALFADFLAKQGEHSAASKLYNLAVQISQRAQEAK